MNLEAANAVAELLSVLSGVLLFFPAVGLNRHLRAVKKTEDQLANATTDLSKAIAQNVKPDLERLRIPQWSQRDQTLLILAIVLFAVSSAIKLFASLNPVLSESWLSKGVWSVLAIRLACATSFMYSDVFRFVP